jgi:ABC-2 type transport system permease protein
MNHFWIVLKTALNVNYGISALKYRFQKEKDKAANTVFVGLAAALGIGSVISMYTMLLAAMFFGLAAVQQQELILTFSFMIGQLLVMFFGMFYIMSAFYFSRDLNILLPLPLKPWEVMGSKFAVVMMNEYLTVLPALIPALVIYGVGTGQGLLYWIKGCILILAAPIIPLAMGAILMVILMRFVNFRKSKDLLAIIGGFIGLLLALGFNFFMQRLPQGNEEEFMNNLMSTQRGMIEAVGQKFPPSIWATLGLTEPGLSGWGYTFLFLLVSAAFLGVMLWLGSRWFYKSILSGQEINRKKRKVSDEELSGRYSKTSSDVMAVFWREWRLFFRTPLYVINGMTGVVIGPFLVVMPLISNQGTGGQLLKLLHKPGLAIPVTLGAFAFMLFVAGMNIVASTAVSREGSTFWISKMIPVPPGRQVLGKLLHGCTIAAIGVVVTDTVVVALLGVELWRGIVLLLLGLLGGVLTTVWGLLIDVLRPKLEWTNAHEAVKQNLNGFLGILAALVLLLFLGGAGAIFFILHVPEILVYFLLLILMTALTIPSLWGLFKGADWSYDRIEM